jgi:hypothetical protein
VRARWDTSLGLRAIEQRVIWLTGGRFRVRRAQCSGQILHGYQLRVPWLVRFTQSGLDFVPAARPLRTVTNADTSCAALLQWKPIRVPYQNHEDELVSKRTDISPEEVSARATCHMPRWDPHRIAERSFQPAPCQHTTLSHTHCCLSYGHLRLLNGFRIGKSCPRGCA